MHCGINLLLNSFHFTRIISISNSPVPGVTGDGGVGGIQSYEQRCSLQHFPGGHCLSCQQISRNTDLFKIELN